MPDLVHEESLYIVCSSERPPAPDLASESCSTKSDPAAGTSWACHGSAKRLSNSRVTLAFDVFLDDSIRHIKPGTE